jgi:hypothetical protein
MLVVQITAKHILVKFRTPTLWLTINVVAAINVVTATTLIEYTNSQAFGQRQTTLPPLWRQAKLI